MGARFVVKDSNGQKLANALARKLLLLLGKSVVTVSETQKRCRVGFGGHHAR
jgi:hypothetical protein